VYVKRRANGIDLAQWVRDPRHHQHDYDSHPPGHSTQSKDVSAPSLATTFLLDSFVPVLSAASSPATFRRHAAHHPRDEQIREHDQQSDQQLQ
jgi:hypothetical protein